MFLLFKHLFQFSQLDKGKKPKQAPSHQCNLKRQQELGYFIMRPPAPHLQLLFL